MKKVGRFALALSPLTVVVLPLCWLSSNQGVEWTYSLWNTDHLLNFGGNPAEVYSHLLNWIVMTGSVGSLCTAWFASLNERTGRQRGFWPVAVFIFSMVTLIVWAGYLDSRSGEGAVVMSFILFFGPCVSLLFIAVYRFLDRGNPKVAVVSVCLLFIASIVLQWFYQRSDTGGPNILVVPLLGAQTGLFWIVVAWLRRRGHSNSSLAPSSKNCY